MNVSPYGYPLQRPHDCITHFWIQNIDLSESVLSEEIHPMVFQIARGLMKIGSSWTCFSYTLSTWKVYKRETGILSEGLLFSQSYPLNTTETVKSGIRYSFQCRYYSFDSKWIPSTHSPVHAYTPCSWKYNTSGGQLSTHGSSFLLKQYVSRFLFRVDASRRYYRESESSSRRGWVTLSWFFQVFRVQQRCICTVLMVIDNLVSKLHPWNCRCIRPKRDHS